MGQHKYTDRTCIVCGCAFKARTADLKKGWGSFCSRKCKNKGEFNPHYRNGGLTKYEYKLRAKKKNPLRFHAMQMVQNATRNGTLLRGQCEVCGCAKTEAHHEDYSKPLQVRWLCKTHHVAAHH